MDGFSLLIIYMHRYNAAIFFYLWRFQYKRNLTQQLQKPAHIVSVFQEQVMQGQTGVVVNISTAELKGKVHTIPTVMSQI